MEATTRKEHYLETKSSVDIVAAGEGEIIFQELLKELLNAPLERLENVKGIAFRKDGKVVVNPAGDIIKDLASVPSAFLDCGDGDWVGSYQMIETTRGCGYRCAYCVWHRYASLRYFPLERVIEELKFLLAHPRVRGIYFCDADSLISKERSLKIWETISRYNKDNKMCAFEVNPVNIEPEHIEFLSKHPRPAVEIHCPFQTSNKSLNKVLNRNFDMDKINHNIRLLRESCPTHNIMIDFTYGWPHQSMESFVNDTLTPVLQLKPTMAVVMHFLVLPGTKFHEQPDRYGIVDYNREAPYEIRATTAMSRYEIENLHTICQCIQAIYRRHYLRESFYYLMSHIKEKSYGQLFVELSMHLISTGGAHFLREPDVKRRYIKYAKELCERHKLSDDVYREFFRILSTQPPVAPLLKERIA